MKKPKMLVIGNSGSGKSTCVNLLATDKIKASMDDSYLVKKYLGLQKTVDWILNDTGDESVIASNAHETLFWDLAAAKNRRDNSLDKIFIVYLYNSVPSSRYERLKSSGRAPDHCAIPMSWDPLVNDLCRLAADISINTVDMTPEEVAGILKTLSAHLKA